VCVCEETNTLNEKFKEDKIFIMKWKLCEEKNHSGAAKPKKSTIQKQTFNSDMKPIVNTSQLDLLPEGVSDGFLYLRADP